MHPLPPVPTRAEVAEQIDELLDALLERPYLDDRIEWLDSHGWLMPRDAIALAEIIDAHEQTKAAA